MTDTRPYVAIVADNGGELIEVVGPIEAHFFGEYHDHVDGLVGDLAIDYHQLTDPADFAERLEEEAAPKTDPPGLRLDRPHRFWVGALVRHVDESGGNFAIVVAHTLRVRDGVAYPTYTLRDNRYGSEVDDVLCTLDLVSA